MDAAATPLRRRRKHFGGAPPSYVPVRKDYPTAFSMAARALHLSDNDLAQLLGIRPDTAKKWRSGRRAAPAQALDMLGEKIARLRDHLCVVAFELQKARAKKEAAD